MKIVVVTPVLNAKATIGRTIDSVLCQKADFRYVIVDGGSTDGTLNILDCYSNEPRIEVRRKGDRSLYEGVRNGFSATDSDLMAYINADDFYTPWAFATIVSVFEEFHDVEWLMGIPCWFDEATGRAACAKFAPVAWRPLLRAGLYHQAALGGIPQESVFWKRSLWEKSAPDDILLKYRLAGDYHLWRRFAENASLYTISSILACFTLSTTQLSSTNAGAYLAECGYHGRHRIATRAWGLAQRLLACFLAGRVIRPRLYAKR